VTCADDYTIPFVPNLMPIGFFGPNAKMNRLVLGLAAEQSFAYQILSISRPREYIWH
jgi:hypothetical protein